MQHYKQALNAWSFGSGSLLLGMLGAIFSLWVPFGMVLSIMGMLAGFIGLTFRGRSAAVSRLLVAGMLVSIAALTLDCVVAANGWEWIEFHALR